MTRTPFNDGWGCREPLGPFAVAQGAGGNLTQVTLPHDALRDTEPRVDARPPRVPAPTTHDSDWGIGLAAALGCSPFYSGSSRAASRPNRSTAGGVSTVSDSERGDRELNCLMAAHWRRPRHNGPWPEQAVPSSSARHHLNEL